MDGVGVAGAIRMRSGDTASVFMGVSVSSVCVVLPLGGATGKCRTNTSGSLLTESNRVGLLLHVNAFAGIGRGEPIRIGMHIY